MTEVWNFGPDKKKPFPYPGHTGLSIVPIQLPARLEENLGARLLADFGSKPFFLDRDAAVACLYLEPHGELHEHEADQPTVFIVIGGSGFVRVGGPDASAIAIKAGQAVLWPPFVLHKAWTEGEPMQVITVEYSAESVS